MAPKQLFIYDKGLNAAQNLGTPNYGPLLSFRFSNGHVWFKQSVTSEMTASVAEWSEFLAANPEVPGLISGSTKFSE
jgi:hypothetical protein